MKDASSGQMLSKVKIKTCCTNIFNFRKLCVNQQANCITVTMQKAEISLSIDPRFTEEKLVLQSFREFYEH